MQAIRQGRQAHNFTVHTSPPNEQTPDTANANASASAEPELNQGTKIGGCYVLRENRTKSGGSPIWLASDEVLGKDVTLHFVPAAVAADVRAMTELRQEVKRNRQLIHPNILRVYDFVEDGNYVAISMDTFEGESLQEVLAKKGRLDPEDMKPWIAQLVETLADAHRIQLFHRDLSPGNIWLRPNGGLLVANFGVSRVILNALERAGLRKGDEARLAYESPQQIDGNRPCASDDIYGLGVLMHQLLGGTPPFAGDDLMPQIRKTVPDPISVVRAAAGAALPVPASWEKLISGCLEKTPEARPRSLTDVLTLLGQDSGPARPRETASAVEKIAPRETEIVPAGLAAPIKTAAHADAPSAGSAPEKSALATKAEEKPVPPLHPDIPPIGQGAAPKKAPAKAVLSANFPDLERPRSKAPLVWLGVAAGILGIGLYLRPTQEPPADAEGSVARFDPAENAPGALPAKSPENDVTDSKGTDILPDPQPILAPKTATNPPAGTAHEVAKTVPSPAVKPSKSGGLIGSDPTPVTPATETVVPATFAAASAGLNGKTADTTGKTPSEKSTAPDKTIPLNKAATVGEKAGTPPPILVAANTHLPEKTTPPVKPPETAPPTPPQPPVAAKMDPLPKLPEPLAPLPKLALPAKATAAELEDARQQREAALESIRKTIAAADAAHQEATRRLDAAKAEKEKRQKAFDAKRKALAPVIHEAEAIETERKKTEGDMAKAQAAAAEAAKQAEAAKAKLEAVVAKGGEKLKARQQAETEMTAATAEISGLGKELDELAQLISKADTLRQQGRLAQQQADQDLQKISASSEQMRRAEVEAMRKVNQEKIAANDKKIQELKAQSARFEAALGPLKELGEAGREAIKKIEEKQVATNQEIATLEGDSKKLSGGAGDLPVKPTGMGKPPVAPPDAAVEKNPPPVKETAGAANSLGMKFAAVGDAQFSVNLTTVKEFESFASATGLKSEAWRNPGFKQGPDYPVVNVTWREAEAFCKWLTEKERKAGLLKSGEAYRLPTDLEWSKAVGLPAENGATPEERDMGVQDVYPWGTQWPPPAGAGNYAGVETNTEIPIPDYNDGFPNTSPVGKFRVNSFGLYDMGGNVWQWVSDFWNGENRAKTLRGGSWYNGAIPLSLLSSCRISSSPDTLHDTYGFRIVKAAEAARSHRRKANE